MCPKEVDNSQGMGPLGLVQGARMLVVQAQQRIFQEENVSASLQNHCW